MAQVYSIIAYPFQWDCYIYVWRSAVKSKMSNKDNYEANIFTPVGIINLT